MMLLIIVGMVVLSVLDIALLILAWIIIGGFKHE